MLILNGKRPLHNQARLVCVETFLMSLLPKDGEQEVLLPFTR